MKIKMTKNIYNEFLFSDKKFGSIPKWVWNISLAEMSKEEIYEQFKGFTEKDKYCGVMIVLWNTDGYMTENYFEKYSFALETAEKFDMNIIIWDENGFPSGYAGGEVDKNYPEFTAKRIDMEEINVNDGFSIRCKIEKDFEGAVVFNIDTNEIIDVSTYVNDGFLSFTAINGNWKVMIFYCVTANSANVYGHSYKLIDYFDKKAVEKFIELTHQRYYDRFSKYFGNVIKYAFYDEPAFWHIDGGRIWTKEFKNKFFNKYGFSAVLLYPSLWYDIGEDTAWARNMLLGFRAELYSNEYIGTLSEWCNNHNIELTGHMDQEEIVNPVPISGDLFKVFKNQDIPGVDEINYYGRGSCAYKITSSAAVCYDKERVMCEVFGAMGEAIPTETLLKEAIDMLAKGINFFVPHGTWYSNDPTKIIFPPELSFRSEKFATSLAEYNEYVRGCSALLSGGRLISDIAILYPIHDLQAQYKFGVGEPYTGGVNPEHSDYLKIGEMLSLEIRNDFIFVHPEILEEKCRVDGDSIYLDNKINYQKFKVLIIPGMEVISCKNLRKVTEFYDNGGLVISTSKLPTKSVERGFDSDVCKMINHIFGRGVNSNKNGGNAYFIEECTSEKLKLILENSGIALDVLINTYCKILEGSLSYLHKEKDGIDIYYFGNSSNSNINMKILLKDKKTPVILNPHTKEKKASDFSIVKYNNFEYTSININLSGISSIFIISENN